MIFEFIWKDKYRVKRLALVGNIRELTNRRLWLDDAVGFHDMPTAHARKGTYRRRVKVDNVSDSNLPAS